MNIELGHLVNGSDISSTASQAVKQCERADQLKEGQRYILIFMDPKGSERFSKKVVFRGLSEGGLLGFDIIPEGMNRTATKRERRKFGSMGINANDFNKEETLIRAYLIQEPPKRKNNKSAFEAKMGP